MEPANILINGVGVDAALVEHIRARLGRKLERFDGSLQSVQVRIEPADEEVRCRIDVTLADQSLSKVEARGDSPRQAFDRAATDAEQALARAFERAPTVPWDRERALSELGIEAPREAS